MWSLTEPLPQLLLRALVIYVFLHILLRLGGKQQIGELAPFDFVVLLLVGNAVENGMTGGDESVTAGMVLATVLIGIGFVASIITHRSRRAERFIDGDPALLVHNGRFNERIMKKERITRVEVLTALRHEGCFSLADVKFAIMETTGKISVLKKSDEAPEPDEVDDLRR